MMAPPQDAPDRDGPAIRAAALLAWYDPYSTGGKPRDPEETEDLTAIGRPVTRPPGAWSLHPLTRRRLLQRFDSRDDARALLAAQTDAPDIPVQRGIALLLAGPEAVTRAMTEADPQVLAGLVQARGWLDGVPALSDGLPGTETLTQSLQEARRSEPLRKLVGSHFSGRGDILDQLRQYIEAPGGEQDILFLYGPGGIGKSSVLAKFALDARQSGLLDAVVYLNLDRAVLRAEEPLTLLEDMLLQIRGQIAGAEDTLAPAIENVSHLLQQLTADTADTSLLESVMTFSGGRAWESVLDDTIRRLNALAVARPMLVMVDTFELAWNQGREVVSEIWRLGQRLAHDVPQLRIVAAGRVTEPGFTANAVPLQALEKTDVARILAEALGQDPDPALIDAVHDGTDGYPLMVRLTAIDIAQQGAEAFSDPEARARLVAQLRDRGRMAFLTGRVLNQITDPMVRRLASPGLALRRITVPAIHQILAGPCALPLAEIAKEALHQRGENPGGRSQTTREHLGAEALFARLAAQLDLVTPDDSDPGGPALVHRRDVRALMLPPLRQHEAARAREIDDRAVAFYAGQPGRRARAEEIYHRLWRGDTPEVLSDRWSGAAAPYLADALPELPDPARDWLARHLGDRAGLEQFHDGPFAGRDAALDRIARHIAAPGPQPPLQVCGPGGVGKSTLVAQAVRTAQVAGDAAASVYLDLSLLPPETLRQFLPTLLVQAGEALPESAPGQRQSILDLASAIMDGVPPPPDFDAVLPQADAPTLIVLDNLEALDRMADADLAARIAADLSALALGAARLRLIGVGRHPLPGLHGPTLTLGGLGPTEVAALVQKIAGDTPSDAVLDAIVATTGGRPQMVRLLAHSLAGPGRDAVLRGLEQGTTDPEEAVIRSRLLFHRILDGIKDPTLHAIAAHCLVLRLLDADLLLHVLGPALDLALDPAQAPPLMRALRDLTRLVTDTPKGDDLTLQVFGDVRRILLPEVREADPQATARIDSAAVTWFAARKGLPDRAEELYHRLWRGDDATTLDARWNPDCADLLTAVLPELPPRAQGWLSAKLGTGVTSETAFALDQPEWEAARARMARQLLAKGAPAEALDTIRQRHTRLPGSVLYDLEAEILLALGRAEDADRVLQSGLASLDDAPDPHRRCEMLLFTSLFRERRRAFSQAAEIAARAAEQAAAIGDDELHLRAISALLRLYRKTRARPGPPRDALVLQAMKLVFSPPEDPGTEPGAPRTVRPFVAGNPALARGLAAELGAEAPELLELGLGPGMAFSAGDSNTGALIEAVTDRLLTVTAADIGNTLRKALADGPEATMRLVPELLGRARDSNALDQVAKPLSWVLAADVDQRIGAVPSRSMMERHTGLDLGPVQKK
ncbi:AAA family ATPase [Sagittula salina]|uniref:ATP-binding protein n=1 Tax=Sagittula salina TaxID=2820268 RepID=A0A940MP81_9RHOB|nr:AAA family ATPase [Sagittula salina]MBP0482221.1 ATP-binding protein [Sagittula salina]